MRYELLLIAATAFAACYDDHSLGALDPAGNTGQDDAGSPATQADAPPVASVPDARTLGPLGPVESWTGYMENYQYAIGTDTVRFSFASDASGQVAGSVVFGSGTPPAPATDPTVGYPPGYDPSSFVQFFTGAPEAGFSFTMIGGTLVAGRLRFTVSAFELWDGWCRLQPAPTDGSDMCVPNWGGGSNSGVCYQNSPEGKKVVVDCGRLDLCFIKRVCACSPSGCVAHTDFGPMVSFDMFLANGTAGGSLAGSLGDHNVHFVKDP